MELTSSPILMDTSPSRYTVVCTSRVRPTSRYCTLLLLAVPLVKSAVLLVITGTRLPIKILAFSLLRARMRGLAKVLVLPTVCRAFAVRLTDDTWMVLAFWWLRSDKTSPDAPPVAPAVAPFAIDEALAVKELGGVMPRLRSLLRAISSTSTS